MDETIDYKEIKDYLKSEFGIEVGGRMHAVGKKVFVYTGKELDIEGRYGMYLGTYDNGFRPSVYASQLATKGFTDLDEKQASYWMCGLDVKKDAVGYYTMLRFGKYTIGVGKPKEGKIINNLPKNRRLPLSSLK